MGFFSWLFNKNKPRELKLGLALGSGGAKGFAHLGAIKAFEENGIQFDYIAGTSIGSIVGAFYADGYSSTDILELLKRIDFSEFTNLFMTQMDTSLLYKVIKKHLGDLEFNLLPNSFFQLNLKQTEVLYDNVLKYAKFDGTERVLDAYCGVGTIGTWISKHVKEVRGIDNNKEAIINAQENVKRNKITNASYYCGDILQRLEQFKEKGWTPDVIVVDPPRMGMDIRLLNYIQKNPVKKIVYVSCNPATLAKNCDHLQRQYHILAVQCLDMFPQTANVESIVLLTHKNAK